MYGLREIRKMNADAVKVPTPPKASVRFNKTLGGTALAAILSHPRCPDFLHVNLRGEEALTEFKGDCAKVGLDFDTLVKNCEYDEGKVTELVNIYVD
jgi:hypothetical protein